MEKNFEKNNSLRITNEFPEKRGACEREYGREDHSHVKVLYSGNVNYFDKEKGAYLPKSNKLVHENGRYKSLENDKKVSLPDGTDDDTRVIVSDENGEISMRYLGTGRNKALAREGKRLKAPKIKNITNPKHGKHNIPYTNEADTSVTYTEIGTGCDLEYIVMNKKYCYTV